MIYGIALADLNVFNQIVPKGAIITYNEASSQGCVLIVYQLPNLAIITDPIVVDNRAEWLHEFKNQNLKFAHKDLKSQIYNGVTMPNFKETFKL